MQGIDRIHYRPREGATYEAPLDILIPALMKLRECDDIGEISGREGSVLSAQTNTGRT